MSCMDIGRGASTVEETRTKQGEGKEHNRQRGRKKNRDKNRQRGRKEDRDR